MAEKPRIRSDGAGDRFRMKSIDPECGLITVRRVTSITIKVPDSLDRKLRLAAKKRGETLSAVARHALEKEVETPAPDFAQLAARYRGMFSGPRDLSSREGYGG